MSTNNKSIRMLKHSEVSKKIIAKPHKLVRSHAEWCDHSGKYKDERIAEYNKKKNDFLATAQAYNRMNKETMINNKSRLHANYEEALNLDFLKEKESPEEECDEWCVCLKCPKSTGSLLKKRSLRHMTQNDEPKAEVCSMEPWFRRFLVLNKLIWAARSIIIQNRLLKVLTKLKTMTIDKIRAIEDGEPEKTCEDYHCHPVFLRFL